MAFAGPMGTSPLAGEWSSSRRDDTQTEAKMWVEVDLKNVMRAIPGSVLNGRIRRVMDVEMAAIKAAVESAAPGCHAVSQIDGTREHLIETYRKKAKHYDVISRLYPVPGYPQRAQRLRAVRALGLRPGDSVVDIACGTGLNFSLIEQAIGPEGRIVGVDLTDAMLAQARHRIRDQRLEQRQARASRRGRVRLPDRGRRDPFHLRDDAGARMRRRHRPRRRGPVRRWTLGRAGSQGVRTMRRGGWRSSGSPSRGPSGRIDEWIVRRPWEEDSRTRCTTRWPISPGPSCSSGRAFLAAGSPRTPSGRMRLRKWFRKALIGQTGAVELGSIPFVQPQPESLLITFGSWAMIVIGTSCPGAPPIDP